MKTELFFSIASAIFTGMGLLISCASLRAADNANRKASQIKSLDLRIELKKALTGISLDLSQLPFTIQGYCDSWRGYWASKNMGNQGISNAAAIEAGQDGSIITRLRQALPENRDHEKRPEKELEELIVKVHGAQLQTTALKEKYAKKVRDLEEERKKYQEAMQAKYSNPTSAFGLMKFVENGGHI